MPHEHPQAGIDTDRRLLVRAAARLLGTAEAEDAVQDAYVRALEARSLELNAAQAWLLTVVRNQAIDRLRRRQWMQQWLAGVKASTPLPTSPSAETQAVLAQETARALRELAAWLTPVDGAAVLLFEVFEASHAEIARASGVSEAASRQQVRRALMRLRQAGGAAPPRPHAERDSEDETVFHRYLQSLQLRDPHTLWAMLREPPIRSAATATAMASTATVATAVSSTAPSPSPSTVCGVVQVGGQLGLVLTLDGVALCVLPLGVLTEHAPQTATL
ncbi:sigma-70 family RNA polymerase sigma factor [Hydrogenophaga sp.]|uniref:sigma-70 family RNA polymerase sigma factor n=1 Tax=Hydrogenophaga sp. TaxID=1904254 RepID=UPI00271C10AF|nr:sigma-70 family RNA polymerase sigma factor [Hydrogenophaga sp.]MDO9438866.1 sigma-70 family RNA polymerase sigma factor [Hydrogenophaga sp.]